MSAVFVSKPNLHTKILADVSCFVSAYQTKHALHFWHQTSTLSKMTYDLNSIPILRGVGWKSIFCRAKINPCVITFSLVPLVFGIFTIKIANAIIFWLFPKFGIMILMHNQTIFGIQMYITLVTGIFNPIMFWQNMNF